MPRRRLALLAAGLVVVALMGVVIARANLNAYRGPIERRLTEALGRRVSVGWMRVSVSPLALRVDQVVIGEDPAFQAANPFVRIDTLYVSPRFLALLRGRFELRTLELRAPTIELVRNADGRWNVASLGGRSADGTPSKLVLNQLRITGGQVAVTDHVRSAPGRVPNAPPERVVYRNIDLQVDGYETGRPFAIALATTVPGPGAQRVSVRGTIGPLAPDAPTTTPFSGVAQFDGVSLSGLGQFVAAAVTLDGTDAVTTGRVNLNAQGGRMRAAGTLELTGVRVRKTELGYPASADVDIAFDSGTGRVVIDRGALRLGTIPVSVTGTVETGPSSPVVDLHVIASDASLTEAARLAAVAGVAFGVDTRVDGHLQADVRVRGPADRAIFEGLVRLRDVIISGRDLPRPVRTPSLDLTLTPDDVRSNPFVATVDDTSIGARFVLGRYTTTAPTVDAHLTARDADLSSVLSIARAWGVQAADGVQGSGRLTLDVRAVGTLTALRYSGNGALSNASLRAPSLSQPFRIQRAGLTFASDAVSLDNLQVSLGKTTAGGRVTIRRFAAPVIEFQLAADTLDVVEMQTVFAPVNTPGGTAVSVAPDGAPPSAAETDGGFLRLATGSGRLRVGRITNGALALEDVQATTTLDRGVLRLDPLTASVYGGRHQGAVVVDASRTPATFSITSSLEQVDANRLATATTNVRDVIYGASTVRVSTSTNGIDSIAKSLNGTITLSLPNGRIAKMDLLQEAAAIGRFVTGNPRTDRSTPVAALTGTFTVTNGVARTGDLRASLDGGSLGATGTINLVDERVAMRLTAVLSREASQQAGGSRVGGFMTTALANENGELVVPMLLSGTMSQPRFAPDVQRIVEMKAKNLVPSLRRPGALTGRIFDAVTGRTTTDRAPESPPSEAPPTAPPADGESPASPTGGATPSPAPTAKPPAERLKDALRKLQRGRRPEPTPPPSVAHEDANLTEMVSKVHHVVVHQKTHRHRP
jgi:AsmA protein